MTFLVKYFPTHLIQTFVALAALRKSVVTAISTTILAASFFLAPGIVSAQSAGIGGYDLASPDDQILPFDYDSSGKADHLLVYRPGTGIVWILANSGGVFYPVFASSDGIGGYDLKSTADRIFALDYNSSGHADHLVCYRPGTGVIYILENMGGAFFPVVTSTSGIGGFDLRSTSDIGLAFDSTSSGNYDTLLFYRPGTNVAFSLQNSGFGNGFQTTYFSGYGGKGLGSFNLGNPADRVVTTNLTGYNFLSLVGYTPGVGTASVLLSGANTFNSIISSTSGIGGYDLRSSADQITPFDYNSTGHLDHLVMYRPGTGLVWIQQWVSIQSTTGYAPVFQSPYDSEAGHWSGIGSFDLLTAADRIVAYDYNSSGHADHLLVYRPGTGVVYILQNTAGSFSPVYTSY